MWAVQNLFKIINLLISWQKQAFRAAKLRQFYSISGLSPPHTSSQLGANWWGIWQPRDHPYITFKLGTMSVIVNVIHNHLFLFHCRFLVRNQPLATFVFIQPPLAVLIPDVLLRFLLPLLLFVYIAQPIKRTVPPFLEYVPISFLCEPRSESVNFPVCVFW